MRHLNRGATALALLVAMLAGSGAQAQPYGYYEDRPPPGYYEDRPIRRAPPARAGGPVGYNCNAVQQGLTGPQPYSCPLPGPRPLGARCYCNMPIASFSTPQTAVGRVSP